jgi:MFS transporter, NNP family, nitrate/nitrite transporter
MVGAFGNVGGVVFLAIYSAVDVRTFFLIAAASAVVGWIMTYALITEPKGQIAEEMPDGTIAMIDVT